MIEITHSREDGTLVDGTSRGDGASEVLKARRFRWSRNLGMWYWPRSRGRLADRYRIDEAADALRGAGFEVEVKIDNAAIAPQEREQARSQRAHDRADALTDKATRHARASDAAYCQSHDAVAGIEPGQPVLVGHHSEARHRRDLARSDQAMRRSVDAAANAGEVARRADAALAADRRRESPDYIGNRIAEKEAMERKLARALVGLPAGQRRDDLLAELEQIRADVAFHRAQLAELEANGVKLWGPGDFEKGDTVRTRISWGTVLRVNKKTLTVRPHAAPALEIRYRYTEVREKGQRHAEVTA